MDIDEIEFYYTPWEVIGTEIYNSKHAFVACAKSHQLAEVIVRSINKLHEEQTKVKYPVGTVLIDLKAPDIWDITEVSESMTTMVSRIGGHSVYTLQNTIDISVQAKSSIVWEKS